MRVTTMTTATEAQKFTFQAEIKQLLHLLSHSLYQSREIAIRELVSNASDVSTRRVCPLTEEAFRETGKLEIVIEPREAGRELIIRDAGIGMTDDELVTNLGPIAHSGSGEFLKTLSGDAKKEADLSLIGSSELGSIPRSWSRTGSRCGCAAIARKQAGFGNRTEPVVSRSRPWKTFCPATEIILHLKDDSKELATPGRIKEIIRRYSSFVPYPIRLASGEVLNDQKAIWVEPRNQVTEEQYTRFRHLTHRTEETPLWHLHLSVDSPIQFHAVLYSPPTNLERFGFARLEHGVNLCARRILVQSDCRELLPDYLRFLRDSSILRFAPERFTRDIARQHGDSATGTSLVKGVLDRLD